MPLTSFNNIQSLSEQCDSFTAWKDLVFKMSFFSAPFDQASSLLQLPLLISSYSNDQDIDTFFIMTLAAKSTDCAYYDLVASSKSNRLMRISSALSAQISNRLNQVVGDNASQFSTVDRQTDRTYYEFSLKDGNDASRLNELITSLCSQIRTIDPLLAHWEPLIVTISHRRQLSYQPYEPCDQASMLTDSIDQYHRPLYYIQPSSFWLKRYFTHLFSIRPIKLTPSTLPEDAYACVEEQHQPEALFPLPAPPDLQSSDHCHSKPYKSLILYQLLVVITHLIFSACKHFLTLSSPVRKVLNIIHFYSLVALTCINIYRFMRKILKKPLPELQSQDRKTTLMKAVTPKPGRIRSARTAQVNPSHPITSLQLS